MNRLCSGYRRCLIRRTPQKGDHVCIFAFNIREPCLNSDVPRADGHSEANEGPHWGKIGSSRRQTELPLSDETGPPRIVGLLKQFCVTASVGIRCTTSTLT